MDTLGAVNVALTASNLQTVTTITPPGSPVVAQAVALVGDLDRVRQSEGWWFNKTLKKTLVPDGGGNISMASTILSVEAWNKVNIYSIRAGLLYDNAADTDVFTGTVDITQTLLIPFDDAPPVYQEYIAREAALQLHQSYRGNAGSSGTVTQERDRAFMMLKRQDSRGRQRSIRYNDHWHQTVGKHRGRA